MVRDESDRQQRLIDLETRLSRSREIIERNRVQRQLWAERADAAQERAWLRAQVADLIASAGSLQDLRDLGISNELLRELGLSATACRLLRGGGGETDGAEPADPRSTREGA